MPVFFFDTAPYNIHCMKPGAIIRDGDRKRGLHAVPSKKTKWVNEISPYYLTEHCLTALWEDSFSAITVLYPCFEENKDMCRGRCANQRYRTGQQTSLYFSWNNFRRVVELHHVFNTPHELDVSTAYCCWSSCIRRSSQVVVTGAFWSPLWVAVLLAVLYCRVGLL